MTRSQATPESSQIITLTRMLEEREETMYAQAAVIEKLREALELIATGEEVNGCIPSLGWAVDIADEALSITTDSPQILAEVRRAEREKCAAICDRVHPMASSNPPVLCAKLIRAMED